MVGFKTSNGWFCCNLAPTFLLQVISFLVELLARVVRGNRCSGKFAGNIVHKGGLLLQSYLGDVISKFSFDASTLRS